MISDTTESSNLYIRFPKIWEDFVEVTWGRQLFDGYKPLKYQLAALGQNYRVERYFGPSENVFRLQGLSPNLSINVQVRVLVDTPGHASDATNSKWLPWASATVTTLSPVSLEVATVSSSYIHGRFNFDDKDSNQKNKAVRDKDSPSHCFVPRKEIQVKLRDRGPFRTFDICEKVFPVDMSDFTVNELQPNMILEVQARSVSAFGDLGHWCEPVRFLTLAAVEVNVVEIGETYAITKWERAHDENCPFAEDAGISELVMIVDILPSQRELDVDSQAKKQQVLAQTFSNETRMYRLRDLLPGRNYIIRTRYRNMLGDWAQWHHVSFATLFPIEVSNVQLVGHNFIQLSWHRGREGSSTGVRVDDAHCVQNWEVRCQIGKATTTMVLPRNEMESKLVNLHSGVDYTIDIRAKNEWGEWGPWSSPHVITTLHRLLPRAEAVGENWIQASWLRRDKVYQDNITRYHVQLSAVENSFRVAKYFPPDVTHFTFGDLRPNTKFHLVLQAYSDNRWGPWSEPVEISTCSPCSPTLVRRGESFIQIRWNQDYYTRSNVDAVDRKYQLRIVRPKVLSAEEEESVAERGGGCMQQSAAPPTEDTIEEVTQSTHRISRLPSYSRIVVQVRLYDFHRQQWGDWGEEKTFRTLPSVIVTTHIGENVAEVSWNRVPRIICAISDEDIDRGVDDTLAPQDVSKYIVKVNAVGLEGGMREFGKYHFDQGQATLFSVTGLSADSIYTVQLSFYDATGTWSAFSAPLKFRTAPPLQISVLDITEGQASLKWGRWVKGLRQIPVDESHFRIIVEDLSTPSVTPVQHSVQGVTQYVVGELRPSTLYRVSISAAMHIHSPFASWSEPIYLCTSSAMEVTLLAVGEDHSVLSWARSKARITELPNARFAIVSYSEKGEIQPSRVDNTMGNTVYIGDATVLEHHMQIQKVIPPTEDDGARESTELIFDAKVHASQTSIRVPSLEPDTVYRAFVCVASQSHQWGSWSAAMEFRTAMPTTLYVSKMTPDAITVQWGKPDDPESFNASVWKYQLRVDGVDEDYHTQVELDREVRLYSLNGLRLDACYAVSLRTHLDTEHDWGQWCKPMYIIIRRVPVEVVESAQNWTHVSWKNTFRPEASAKALFLSLLSAGSATVTSLPASDCNHIFRNLDPSTMYAAHLIAVEQSGHPLKIPPFTLGPARGLQAKKIIGDNKNAPSFSIPIVAVDFSQFLEEGFVFRTQRVLQIRAECIGQNFVLLHWESLDSSNAKMGDQRHGEEDETVSHQFSTDDVFEVETVDGDSSRITKARGKWSMIRGLKPNSTVRCSVRWVAERSDVPCEWCKPITVSLLPLIETFVGSPTISETAGIGEDYLMFHWRRSIRNSNLLQRSDLSFEARLKQVDGDGKGEELVVTTKESGHHFTGLRADTTYELQIRTVIPVTMHGIVEGVKGEWSSSLTCMTLSPISAVAVDVTETTAMICWRRRTAAGTEHDHEQTSTMEGITSFHVRVSKLSESGEIQEATIYDEQFTDANSEFTLRQTRIMGLKPNSRFSASVRASTGLIWGAWSDHFVFSTNSPCDISLRLVADTFAALEWNRPPYPGKGEIAPLAAWDVHFEAIGGHREDIHISTEPSSTRCSIGGLTPNTAYAVKVRPHYEREGGSWSATRYFVTLSPIVVDVGRIGETFVLVQWRRDTQVMMHSKLRTKNVQAVSALTARLQTLKQQLEHFRSSQIDEGDLVFSADESEADPDSEVPLCLTNLQSTDREGAIPQSAPQDASEEYLVRQIREVEQRIQSAEVVASMKIDELEKATVYPSGSDIRFELWIQQIGASQDGVDGYVYKKKLQQGEHSCRVENLTPQTHYDVTVRAFYTNGSDLSAFTPMGFDPSDDGSEIQMGVPWTQWCQKVAFVTLKPIVIKAKGIGSECLVLEWDTGKIGQRRLQDDKVSDSVDDVSSSDDESDDRLKTAISRFQIHVSDLNRQPKQTLTLEDPAVREHVISQLHPNTSYIVSVRVCYDDDRWGVWSCPITFITMPPLMMKLQSAAEKQLEILVWRDIQKEPSSPETIVWRPPVTEHQLSINAAPCTQAFTLETGTSTLLTLDSLTVDTMYHIGVQDKVLRHWQSFRDLLVCETVPQAPQRPILLERKGSQIVIAWDHQRSLDGHQYIYRVEMATKTEVESTGRNFKSSSRVLSSKTSTSLGPFELLGFTEIPQFRLELAIPVHHCFFRVTTCKTNQTVEGESVPVPLADPNDPQSAIVEFPHLYVWSRFSPVGHFRTPSVPDHPTGLHVTNLTHNSALLHWRKPANSKDHTGIMYRVFLNNNYQDRFTCIAETPNTCLELRDLVTNCHYRVAVSAESTMGTSVNNNTLHFSTKVYDPIKNTFFKKKESIRNIVANNRDRPPTSTLPPRHAITAPAEVIISGRSHSPPQSEAFAPLLDDTASPVFAISRRGPTLRPIESRSNSVTISHFTHENSRNAQTPPPILTKRNTLPPL